MIKDKISILDLIKKMNQEWSELRSLSKHSYSEDDIRNSILNGLSNNYHDFALRYSLTYLAIDAHKKPQNQNRDVLNLTYGLTIEWSREEWDRTIKRNYFLDLWGNYEYFLRSLFQIIVSDENRSEIEKYEKNKYKKEPNKVHIPINKICSAVLDTIGLSKDQRKDINKFTTIFLHIRNTIHNNSISSIDYSYDLLGTKTTLENNKVANCLTFEHCFKFAKKSIIIINEISRLLGIDEIKNPILSNITN